jgi:hypothetical protein
MVYHWLFACRAHKAIEQFFFRLGKIISYNCLGTEFNCKSRSILTPLFLFKLRPYLFPTPYKPLYNQISKVHDRYLNTLGCVILIPKLMNYIFDSI